MEDDYEENYYGVASSAYTYNIMSFSGGTSNDFFELNPVFFETVKRTWDKYWVNNGLKLKMPKRPVLSIRLNRSQ